MKNENKIAAQVKTDARGNQQLKIYFTWPNVYSVKWDQVSV